MKYYSLLAGLLTTTATALSIAQSGQAVLGEAAEAERYLIELGPGNTRWITEDEKWVLRRVSQAGSKSSLLLGFVAFFYSVDMLNYP
jgi:hypothetical protein